MKKLLILLMVSVPLTCWAVDKPDDPQRAKLVVQGDALLQVAADQVRFSVGVISEDRDAGSALEKNSRAMRQVEKALIRVGLNKRGVQHRAVPVAAALVIPTAHRAARLASRDRRLQRAEQSQYQNRQVAADRCPDRSGPPGRRR
ncbi:hypothetical protein C2E25_01120 [Geothermobacter hydrogeniphilus]|uniref:LPP20 lipoprotein n=1 Tax=Geothermobacter hydrogeniphilus TaxID=1969733 RepID=A0A2K2HDY2_9BACT|nr:hypothetical protein C2E25_01120 [Geothermobacter hydrogeniphilus]